MNVSKLVNLNVLQMDNILDPNKNVDIIKRNLNIGEKESYIYYIDGLLKDELMLEVTKFFQLIDKDKMNNAKSVKEFTGNLLPYLEISSETEFEKITSTFLSGCVILFIDGFDECIVIDTRSYPQRQIEEPELDKTLRGAKDGFIETPVFNLALIRRRIRNSNLVTDFMSIGSITNNDVIICYMKDKVNLKALRIIKDKLLNLKTEDLVFGSQSLAESLYDKKWFNPFPKIRFTERPDVASSNILEGRIVIIVDNNPSAIILPTYFLDFFQEVQDFYFPPPVANYFKISRILITIFTLFLTPLWLLALQNLAVLPEWLTSFISVKESNAIPIIVQLIFLEFVIEIIKVASINTPSMISSSISLIGAIILR